MRQMRADRLLSLLLLLQTRGAGAPSGAPLGHHDDYMPRSPGAHQVKHLRLERSWCALVDVEE
jgi:hypothetical protein